MMAYTTLTKKIYLIRWPVLSTALLHPFDASTHFSTRAHGRRTTGWEYYMKITKNGRDN